MFRQDLPTSATDYDQLQRREHRDAVAAVRRQWRRMGNDFDAGWSRVAPTITAIILTAQSRISERSAAYIPAVLEDTGQLRAIEAAAATNAAAVVGLAGSGHRVEDVIDLAPIRAKQQVAAGASAFLAQQIAGRWLTSTVATVLSDTARTTEAVGIYTRPVGGYVRMLTPPSCGRCVILAGRRYRKNQGFRRHPGCDCKHIPASEAVAGDLTVDPQAYFDSLDEAGQAKLMGGKANAQAVRDGADMGQVINAYRKTAGMQVAQASPISRVDFGGRSAKVTTEGATRRGLGSRVRTGRNMQARIMPESIYSIAPTQDDALRMLKLHGWIL